MPASYTFGDTDTASRRLALLAQVFGPSSRALLAAAVPVRPGLAYDLGCGPGHTTAMVADVSGAARTVGLDTSAAYIERAATAYPAAEFAVHDVLSVPFPAGPADLIFARMLLAHLSDPAAVAGAWATQLTSAGLLVIDEIEWIRTSQPVLAAHLRLAESMVASGGAQMRAGPLLAGLTASAALRQRFARVAEVPVPTAQAARMFAMNVAAWGDRPVALGLCDRASLRSLAAGLTELTSSAADGEITWGMHQAAYSLAR